jgi:hypothetical protein
MNTANNETRFQNRTFYPNESQVKEGSEKEMAKEIESELNITCQHLYSYNPPTET